MTTILAGDIGGTKTILHLALAHASGTQTLAEKTYSSQDYDHLVPMVKQFLADQEDHPQAACFAIAGPVQNNCSQLTNLDWELESGSLAQALGLAQVKLMNDFAAVGYGILNLRSADQVLIQDRPAQPQAPIAVIGAGTGLGEALLIWSGQQYDVVPLEGGHADFAARTDLEIGLLKYLRDRHGHVSAERVVSGQGIPVIYEYLRQAQIHPESEQVRSQMNHEDPAAVIAEFGLDHRDRLCEKTLDLFVAAYGAEAGNLALKSLPFGGVYIAGGIGPKLQSKMEAPIFIESFLDKGRMRPLLEQMRVSLILNPKVGLMGATYYAQRLVSTS
ncbi:glucokinase [Lyngbya confervoides]|uniref:Glucokinase n=1 Tax=Lyngbya confervoides BDU141951 TaxID=1574623 RepID=A0ABD4T2B0_9CYAN|nr:glucokinase [Lyngbya confervoides]MCM1982833.1 glucokinase [Lyngbya confervoides BDU141951]